MVPGSWDDLIKTASCGLPLFLHNRATGGDFGAMCQTGRQRIVAGGVVHSFDGDGDELDHLLRLGLHIGLNGCSLKTDANLAVAARVPLDALHLETDAPWCGIKRTHAGHNFVRPLSSVRSGAPCGWADEKKERWRVDATVKDRCEPCHIRHVLQVVSGAMGEPEATIADAAYANSVRLFGL